MKNLSRFLLATIFFSLTAGLFTYAEETEPPENVPVVAVNTTLQNLQTAFNGESNANARYLAFAEKADEEGWSKTASYFRAVARGEQIYMERYAKLIKELGGTPTAEIETPIVKSTEENLQAAINIGAQEREVMYPAFSAKAMRDDIEGAAEIFGQSIATEARYADSFKYALEKILAGAAKGTSGDFFVCPVCGCVLQKDTKFESCPLCGENKKNFLEVK